MTVGATAPGIINTDCCDTVFLLVRLRPENEHTPLGAWVISRELARSTSCLPVNTVNVFRIESTSCDSFGGAGENICQLCGISLLQHSGIGIGFDAGPGVYTGSVRIPESL